MKVSIITVCKNAQDTIERTIKSVIAQSYNDIEFIIIDGVSTDNTISIINKYKNNITKFISESDSGIYNAMNKGINCSSGDILYFLNANDYLYDNDVIHNTVKFFNKSRADIVFGNTCFLDESGNIKELRAFDNVDKLFLTQENICHQCIFYKREVFEKCSNYDENYKIIADYDLNLKAIIKYGLKARHMNRFISYFTLGGLSSNDKYMQELLDEKKSVLKKYFKPYHFKVNKILNKTFRSIARNTKLRHIVGKLLWFSLP